MIPVADLVALQSFDSRGGVTLSAYWRLDSRQRREAAYEEFIDRMREHLAGCGPQPECREALKEDMEIIGLYLRANGHRNHAGLAIFSCAAELFWRAYPLPVPVPTLVTVGPKFYVEPLSEIAGLPLGTKLQPEEARTASAIGT